jgi:hypothetical protein
VVLDIAETILGVKGREEGAEVKFPGGLSIRKSDGAWFSFTADRGGFDADGLIELLYNYLPPEALRWALAWLANHPGHGGCTESDDGYHPASKAVAERTLAEAVDIAGTPGWKYLQDHRRIEPPFPADLRFWPHARVGEGALVALLRSQGRIVGVQAVYLDPDGRKSTIEPVKRRYALEKAADAVFEIPARGKNDSEVIVTEGIENALTIYRYGKRGCRILGTPGIHVLRNLKFPSGTKVIFFRDSDPDGSPAAKALARGIDHLVLDSGAAEVRITPRGLLSSTALPGQLHRTMTTSFRLRK